MALGGMMACSLVTVLESRDGGSLARVSADGRADEPAMAARSRS